MNPVFGFHNKPELLKVGGSRAHPSDPFTLNDACCLNDALTATMFLPV